MNFLVSKQQRKLNTVSLFGIFSFTRTRLSGTQYWLIFSICKGIREAENKNVIGHRRVVCTRCAMITFKIIVRPTCGFWEPIPPLMKGQRPSDHYRRFHSSTSIHTHTHTLALSVDVVMINRWFLQGGIILSESRCRLKANYISAFGEYTVDSEDISSSAETHSKCPTRPTTSIHSYFIFPKYHW